MQFRLHKILISLHEWSTSLNVWDGDDNPKVKSWNHGHYREFEKIDRGLYEHVATIEADSLEDALKKLLNNDAAIYGIHQIQRGDILEDMFGEEYFIDENKLILVSDYIDSNAPR